MPTWQCSAPVRQAQDHIVGPMDRLRQVFLIWLALVKICCTHINPILPGAEHDRLTVATSSASSSVSATAISNPTQEEYVVLMDAGSTGTRVYVYSYEPLSPIHSIKELGFHKVPYVQSEVFFETPASAHVITVAMMLRLTQPLNLSHS
jgi:GDA1/CD39 (nucleoside phosphatase) family